MTSDFPSAGQVFDYHYLWKWQDEKGETEGRKKRPSCMVCGNGQHRRTTCFVHLPNHEQAACQ